MVSQAAHNHQLSFRQMLNTGLADEDFMQESISGGSTIMIVPQRAMKLSDPIAVFSSSDNAAQSIGDLGSIFVGHTGYIV
jgi:hypothetical protein